ncbi:MAG: hypothetical protein ACE5IY_01000 [bacterium]
MEVFHTEVAGVHVLGVIGLLVAPMSLGSVLAWRYLKGAFFTGERALLAATFGLALFTASGFLASYLLEFQRVVLIIVQAFMLVAAGVLLNHRRTKSTPIFRWSKISGTRLTPGKTDGYGLLTFLVSLLLFGYLMKRLIVWQDGALSTGFIDAWGDLPFHLSLITSFVGDPELHLRSTILAGEPLTYPFMSDFLSAILMRFGLPLETAVEWPGVLLNSMTLTLLYYLSYRLVRNHAAALLVPVLFILAGGFGFLWFLKDVYLAPEPIWQLLQHLPRRYTNLAEVKIHWVNPTLAHLIPQRSFLFGFPIGLSVILIWWNGFKKNRLENAWAAGLLVGLLPLFHTHTFLTLAMVATYWMVTLLLRSKSRHAQLRPWLIFGGVALTLAAPQIWFLLFSKVSLKAVRYHAGWMADSDNLVWFWLKNLGVFIPLLVTALLLHKRLNIRKQTVRFYLPFGLLFIVGNLFLFAPFAYDNNKILIFWYLLSLPAVARLLVFLYQSRSWWLHAMAFRLALLALVFSGSLNLTHELQGGGWQELSAEEVALAREVSSKTRNSDVFLAAPIHNNFLTLAGRAVVMGYAGHIYSHGLDYVPMQEAIRTIYTEKEGGLKLLQDMAIDYVVVGPNERKEFGAQIDWFRSEYPIFLASQTYAIYKIDRVGLSNKPMPSDDGTSK